VANAGESIYHVPLQSLAHFHIGWGSECSTVQITWDVIMSATESELRRSVYSLLLVNTFIFYVGTVVCFSGVYFASSMIGTGEGDILDRVCRIDGRYYEGIATAGYSHRDHGVTNLAFFPGYPLLVAGVSRTSGLSVKVAMLVVSNLMGLIGVLLWTLWLRCEAGAALSDDDIQSSVIAIAFYPAGFFLRIAYSESLCFCLIAFFCLAISYRWHPLGVAVIAGIITGVRPVGIAATVVACIYSMQWWCRPWNRLAGAACILPVASSGLLCFVAYQWLAFGDPWCFVRSQQAVHYRVPATSWEKPVSMLALEPVWGAYVTGSRAYWKNLPHRSTAPFDMQSMNPIYFSAAVALLAFATYARLLAWKFILMGWVLLLVPYWMRGFELYMGSQGRFAILAFPQFVAMAVVMRTIPRWLTVLYCSVSAILLFCHSVVFALGYFVI